MPGLVRKYIARRTNDVSVYILGNLVGNYCTVFDKLIGSLCVW